MIQTVHNQSHIHIADGSEIILLRNVLSDQTIHVLVRTSFPGSIRMSEKEIRLQFLGDPFVFSKFLAIICGESMQTIHNWLEQPNHSLTHLIGSASIHFAQQGETRLTVCQGDNGLAMSFANEGVHFPITDPLAFLNDFRFIPPTF